MKKTLLTLGLLFSLTVIYAQCGFDFVRQKQLLDPAYVMQEQASELKIKNFIPPANSTNKVGAVISIPVVVHVLHKGEQVGSGTNISDAQIQSAIDRLNVVYRGLDPNSPVDFNIEFALAKRDPDCNATNGINRVLATGVSGYTANGVFMQSVGADENELKDLSRWPETDYFNIWIVSEIDNNGGGSGIQGYANFYYGNAYEGSVMMASVFGYDPGNTNGWNLNSNGDGGTVIHEFGHYFHLYHTFQGDDANVGTNPYQGYSAQCPGDATVGTDSDGCNDTEIHKRLTSTCPTNNDCRGGAAYGINTRNNYMSYFSCTDRLTNDQKTRVTAAMTGTAIASSRGDEAPVAVPNITAASCAPTSTNAFSSSGVFNVELNGFNVTSSGAKTDNDPNGYKDNSGDCNKYFSINAEIPNSMNVTVGYHGNNHQLGVWIDWNNDGDFNDTNEQQQVSTAHTTSSVVNVPLIYPPSINYNSSVRLRVVSDLDAGPVPTSCGAPTYGQAEDYKIYIQPASGSAPVANFNTSNTTTCENTPVTFTDSSTENPTSWSWDFGDGNSSTLQNPTHTYSLPGVYTVTLTATNAIGSDDEVKTNHIIVNANPDLSVTSSTDETCGGNDGTATVSLGVGTHTYLWNTTPAQNTSTATNLAAGTYNVTVTNSSTTCMSSTDVVVENGCAGNPAVPKTKLHKISCGITQVNSYDIIYAKPVSGATSYIFEIVNSGLGFSYEHIGWAGGRAMRMDQIPGVLLNTTYNIRVKVVVGGETGLYGNVCQVTTPTQETEEPLPTSKLMSAYCGETLNNLDDIIYAKKVVGATNYIFNISNTGLGYNETKTAWAGGRAIKLSQIQGVQLGTTYDVKIKVVIDGDTSLYGAVCEVTTPASAISNGGATSRLANVNELEINQPVPTSLTIYPNPNQGEYLYVELADLTPNSELIVTDIYGKQVKRMLLETEEANYNTTVRFDDKLIPGFYMVTVISNGKSTTKKLIVK